MSEKLPKYDGGELGPVQTSGEGQIQYGDSGVTHDAVFGELGGDGPNYRNVGNHHMISRPALTFCSGWLAGDGRSYDEDSDRTRRPLHSCGP